MDDDRLHAILQEWKAPAPGAELDARIHAAWRASRRTSHTPVWRRVWTARVSLPVPAFAALVLLAAALLFALRPAPPAPPEAGRYVTRINATGFEPAPNGEARIVKIEEMR